MIALLLSLVFSVEFEEEEYYIPIPAGLDNGAACEACKFAVSAISNVLQNTKIQSQIKKAAAKLCDRCPVAQDFCKTIVDEYLGTILNLLAKGLSKLNICQRVKLCGNELEELDFEEEDIAIPIPAGLDNGVACEACKFAVSSIKKVLQNTKVQSKVKAAAVKLCDRCPVAQDFCKSIVNNYLGTVMNLIAKGLSNANICQRVKVCGNELEEEYEIEEAVYENKLDLTPINTAVCALCEKLVDYVQEFIEKSLTELEIEQRLNKVCNLVAEPYATACKSLTRKYLRLIIKMVENGFTTEKICNQLRICKNNLESNDDPCADCQNLFNIVQSHISTMDVQKTYKKIKAYCPLIPNVNKYCKEITIDRMNFVIDLLKRRAQPDEICKYFELC